MIKYGKNLLKRIQLWIKTRPVLVLLIGLLIVISLVNVKPGFFIMGWDNFSSYLDLPLNLNRSLSVTWRDYRGLGVPSDSEVVDIFRQITFLGLDLILPLWFVEQAYYLLSLCLGVILMYCLAVKLYQLLIKASDVSPPHNHNFLTKCWNFLKIDNSSLKYQDIIGGLAAVFYLFNLNTLSTFYFPIAMYVTRFWSLPALHLLLLDFMQKKEISKKWLVLAVVVILFTSTSYLTATVFITTFISLLIHGFFYFKWRRFLMAVLIFLLLNLFWLLPFFNYTLQKAGAIQLSTANIEGNEALLNRSLDYFSLSNQLIFYSTYFEMKWFNTETNFPTSFYPYVNQLLTFPANFGLYIFPVIYILGWISILLIIFCGILVKARKVVPLIWIVIHSWVFLVLTLKESGPFGFIYTLMSQYIPYFEIIFRFGDAKFHPYIVLTSSFVAALFMVLVLFDYLPKLVALLRIRLDRSVLKWGHRLSLVVVLLIIIVQAIMFQSYFKGQLVGYFMYNKIPEAYFSIAKIINQDTSLVRVVQIPFDKYGYWRSYSWGYFGSSFWHFLLNKPFLDRTFEPASLESKVLNDEIYRLQEQFQGSTEDQKRITAGQLYQLLKSSSIKYLIVDETVNIQSKTRDQKYWGMFSLVNSQLAARELENAGYIKKLQTYQIDLNQGYEKLPNYFEHKKVEQSTTNNIILYEVINADDRVRFIDKTTSVDPNLNARDVLSSTDRVKIQDFQNYIVEPFSRLDPIVTYADNGFQYSLPNTELKNGTYQWNTKKLISANDSRLLKFEIQNIGNKLTLNIKEVVAPTLNDQEFMNQIDQIELELDDDQLEQLNQGKLRLRVDSIVLEINPSSGQRFEDLGTVLVNTNTPQIQLLGANDQLTLGPEYFNTTTPVDCMGFEGLDYSPYVNGLNNVLQIDTQNGSTCVIAPLDKTELETVNYAELDVQINNQSQDLDPNYPVDGLRSKDGFYQAILNQQKPEYWYFCWQAELEVPCANSNSFYILQGNHNLKIKVDKLIEDSSKSRVVIGVGSIGRQKISAVVSDIKITTYESLSTKELSLPIGQTIDSKVVISKDTGINFKLPITLSSLNPVDNSETKNITFANSACEDPGGYRTTRVLNKTIIMYVNGCGNGIFSTYHQLPANNMLLATVDYNLVSGQYPTLRFYDEQKIYFEERSSLNQGYPNISIFKDLVKFAQVLAKADLNYQTLISSKIIYPEDLLDNGKSKTLSLAQYSANDALIYVNDLKLTAYPSYWSQLSLNNETAGSSYDLPDGYNFSKITSSLWKVNVTAKTDMGGEYLLQFKEGFDTQWKVYSSLWNIIINKPMTVDHYKCAGLFNCYRVITNQKQQEIYMFYEPEKLSLLGINLTILTILVTTVWIWRRNK